MRVLIVTLHREINFGSALQAVALYRAICALGHAAEIVDYTRTNRAGWRGVEHRFRTFRGNCLRRAFTAVEATVEHRIAWKRRFEPFLRGSARLTSRYRSAAGVRQNPPSADVYVTGSDQVWNTFYNSGVERTFLLDFGATETRRTSYAASFGVEELAADHQPEFRALLGRYARIGVRERSSPWKWCNG